MAAAAAPGDGASSINVTVRVRPFTIQEAAQLSRNEDSTMFLGDGSLAAAPTPKVAQKGIRNVIKVVDDNCLIFDPPQDAPVQRYGSTPMGKKVKDTTYAFDRVFDENATQVDVYEASTKNLLDSVLDGFNATVFAYGATGCGKTHTITGTQHEPGIIFMCMQDLFERLKELKETKEVTVNLSYLEIYNETIRDLLNPSKEANKGGLMLREDSNQAVAVAGLSMHHPESVEDVMDIVIKGNAARTQSPTEANATSSRSHAVLQVTINLKDRNAGINEPVTFATLSIIDLAGSERASATKNRGARLQEGANINRSLLALGSCINALCENRKSAHIPYRDSKLTRLLKFSLGGNCRTVMIVCVSPSSQHYDETQNTLRYADRAKKIRTKSIRNVFNVNRHVKDYVTKIADQMERINQLEKQVADGEAAAIKKLQAERVKLNTLEKECVVRLHAAYDNSASERKERLSLRCRHRSVLRRISALTAWVGAFDAACDAWEDEEPIPALTSMRQTAVAILTELENSRSHYQMKIMGLNWARSVDTAIHDCVRQLKKSPAFEEGCAVESSLLKEVEILKLRADLEASNTILEHDRASDALLQIVLQAQFETIAIIHGLGKMSQEDLQESSRRIMVQLQQSCVEALGQVIKPDGSLQITQAVPPTRAGTPRKQKAVLAPSPTKTKIRDSMSMQPLISALPTHVAAEMGPSQSPRVGSSPARGVHTSPKRRVRLGGSARKGVLFSGSASPKKTAAKKKRVVRWKDERADDGGEPGPLVEFHSPPKKRKDPPLPIPDDSDSAKIEPPPSLSSEIMVESDMNSSPLPVAPVASSEPRKAGSGRFASGFLSKTKSDVADSPATLPPSLTLGSFSSEDESNPLREIGANRASQPSFRTITNQSSVIQGSNTFNRENVPEANSSASSSDVEASTLDKNDLNQMRHSMVRKKRSSSMGSNTASRLKERAERRRSPTASSFTNSSPSSDSNWTTSHTRRMLGSGRNEPIRSSILSPRVDSVEKAPIVRPQVRQRQSMVDFNNTVRGETPTGSRPRQHLRASSVVPGSANRSKEAWR